MDDRIQRIHLADDGSEHAAWMLHYGLRLARHLPEPRLQLLHVVEPGQPALAARREYQARLAERYGVTLVVRDLESDRDVPHAIGSYLPAGPEDVVLVGFRARDRGRGLVVGSVGHALLARHDHAVLAMRVVEPGNLGLPGKLAMGLSESVGLDLRLLHALRLFTPDLEQLVLLRVAQVPWRAFGSLGHPELERLLARARAELHASAARLASALPMDPQAIDEFASVSADWPSQLVMDAQRNHAHLLLLGASDHLLPARFSLSNPLEIVLRNAACDVAVFRVAGSRP